MQAKENYLEYIQIREFPEFPPIGLKLSFLTVLSDTEGIFSYVPFLKCREMLHSILKGNGPLDQGKP